MICGFSALAYAGLRWHYDSVHPDAPRGRHHGRPSDSGQERRRRKLLARRRAMATIANAAAADEEADPAAAPPAAVPSTTSPTTAGPHTLGPATAGTVGGGPSGGDVEAPQPLDSANLSAAPLAPLQGDADPEAIEKAVQAELDGLMELARVADDSSPAGPPLGGPSLKRRRSAARARGQSHAAGFARGQPQEMTFSYVTLQSKVRAMFEELGDWKRSAPLAVKRKRAKEGNFNTVRLRALQRFVLSVGNAGLSLADIKKLYDFLGVWDGTQVGQVTDHGHNDTLRDTFRSLGAFKSALRDDIDAGVRQSGWRKCSLVEGGQTYQSFFTPALHSILDLVRDDEEIRLWSGAAGPAPPTARRETALDGDAFRMAEKAVVDEHGQGSCVIGVHMFSDSFQLSWSGGKGSHSSFSD